MRIAVAVFATAAVLLAGRAFAAQPADANGEPPAPTAEAIVHVAFPAGTFKPRPPELKVIHSLTGRHMAQVRAKEWTARSAVYSVSLPSGHRYGLRMALPGEMGSFAQVALAEDASGKLVFKVPYAPRRAMASR